MDWVRRCPRELEGEPRGRRRRAREPHKQPNPPIPRSSFHRNVPRMGRWSALRWQLGAAYAAIRGALQSVSDVGGGIYDCDCIVDREFSPQRFYKDSFFPPFSFAGHLASNWECGLFSGWAGIEAVNTRGKGAERPPFPFVNRQTLETMPIAFVRRNLPQARSPFGQKR